MSSREKLIDNIKKILKESDSEGMTINVSNKDDITLVDLEENLTVSKTFDDINVWGTEKGEDVDYENAEYQLYILRTSLDNNDIEQNLLYPLLSALRLSQQPFSTIAWGDYKNLSPKTVVVLLVDTKNYADRSRVKKFVSHFIGRCENFFIATSYEYYASKKYTYELFEKDELTFGKIFPLLPISDGIKEFTFQTLNYRELASIRTIKQEPSYLDAAVDSLSENLENRINAIKDSLYYSLSKKIKPSEQENTDKQDLRPDEYRNDYDSTIGSKLNTLTYLAQIIWLTMLKWVAEKVDDDYSDYHIVGIKNNNEGLLSIEKVEINKELIANTYLSAIEYADGIYQILENSVLHSSEKIGFFSMRSYYVDCDAPPSRAVDCARYRQAITHRCNIRGNKPFENCRYMIEFTAVDYAVPIPDNEVGRTVYERKNFYSSNVSGIYEVFKRNNQDETLDTDTLESVFNFRSGKTDQIAHHLGLKLFRTLIEENGGIVMVGSPRQNRRIDSICYFHKYARKTKESIKNKVRGFTWYSVILPIREQVPKFDSEYRGTNSLVEYDSVFEDKIFEPIEIEVPNAEICRIDGHYKKIEIINEMRNYCVKQILSKKTENIVIPVIPFKLVASCMEDCERFAKMSLLVQDDLRNEPKYASQKLCLALNFISEDPALVANAIGFFIRIYASFYKKAKDGEIPVLGDSQLAIFVSIKGKSTQYVLNLCGKTSMDLCSVAEHFVYMGFPFAFKQAHQLRTLFNNTTNKNKKRVNKINLFPCDLFVKDCNFPQDSVFVSSLKGELNKELGERNSQGHIAEQTGSGVCIKSTHIALSSGIHLDTFYQAELLFHNNFVIKNFAILIVRDLIRQLKRDEYNEAKQNGIVVIGYENYSHVLMEQIACYLENKAESLGIGNILNDSENPHITYCTFAGQIDIVNGIKTRVVPRFRFQHLVRDINNNIIDVQMSDLFIKGNGGQVKSPLFVIVEPIATTSNTILQIRHTLRHFSDKEVASINYSLIIAAPKNGTSPDEGQHGLDIRSQYWDGNGKDSPQIDQFGTIQLKPDYPNGEKQVVRYMIHVGSNWYIANDCPMCNKDVALDWVDKTSTSTYLIHELLGSNRKGITYALQTIGADLKKVNDDRIEFLRGHIAYGHTQTQANHFLFNLDLKQILESRVKRAIGSGVQKVTCREDVEKWLKNIRLDSAAFNVFIAPLHERNSPFVRMVSEFALQQNIRFIHFDVLATPREAVRTNFIHVANEISKIINDNPHNKVNVYYCDDSNVSGESIHRAMLLIKMILNEAHLAWHDYSRICLLKGIILFVNRSSYESLQQFVNNPETDVYSYIHLGVPNYNTHQGICYDCSFIKKLELERKRTVSSHDICDIDRSIKKHRLLTVTQFWDVIKSELFTSGKYVKWLKSWRLINPRDKFPEEINKILKALKGKTSEILSKESKTSIASGKKDSDNKTPENYEELNSKIKAIDKLCLDDLISKEEKTKYRDNIWQFFKNRVIADRYYLRLLCTHRLYCALEHISKSAKSNSDLYKNTLVAVLDLLIEEKRKVLKDKKYADTPKGKQRALVYFCELLISYIKILSREQLVRFYHIRQVAIDLMLYLLISCIYGVNNARGNACNSGRVRENDDDIFDRYNTILEGLIFSKMDKTTNSESGTATQENSLNAGTQAFLVISLIKKIANLDSTFFMRKDEKVLNLKISEFSEIWTKTVDKYLGINDYSSYYNKADKKELMSLTTMPSFAYFVNVYQNALRWTLLTTYDDEGKSFRVEDAYKINEEVI